MKDSVRGTQAEGQGLMSKVFGRHAKKSWDFRLWEESAEGF